MTSLQETLGNKIQEKNRWPVSFLLAAGLHFLLLFGGGLALIQSPDFGMQGSSASLEVTMVAALPEQRETRKTVKAPEEQVLDIVEVKGEMEVDQSKNPKEEDSAERNKQGGDGSSKEPGKSSTTFFSRGSSATSGKEGKYQNPPPQYPASAMQRGLQGVVLLRALIEKEGEAAEVLIEKSSGHTSLDEAALKAVKKWKFTPGHVGAVTVSSWIKIPVRFELAESGKNRGSRI